MGVQFPVQKHGAPKGNRNSAKDRIWRRTLKEELDKYEDGEKVKKGDALREIAREAIRQAINGDAVARAEIANRLDGKSTEHVEIDVTSRLAEALTDDELADIASGSGDGIADAPTSTPEPTEIH